MAIDTSGLTPNSNKYKESKKEKEPLEKVVTGEVKTRKKTFGRRIADLFFVEDRASVKEYLIFDVVVPAIKSTLVDSITKAANLIFYGTTSSKSSGYTDYRSISGGKAPVKANPSARFSPDDIIFESRGEAEHVRQTLLEVIDVYGQASVADLYDLAGITGNGYTDRSYGWTDLSSAYISSVREGYLLILPKAKML